jgi:hypothetical protein
LLPPPGAALTVILVEGDIYVEPDWDQVHQISREAEGSQEVVGDRISSEQAYRFRCVIGDLLTDKVIIELAKSADEAEVSENDAMAALFLLRSDWSLTLGQINLPVTGAIIAVFGQALAQSLLGHHRRLLEKLVFGKVLVK